MAVTLRLWDPHRQDWREPTVVEVKLWLKEHKQGPQGTLTSPNPRPRRLTAQCKSILDFLRQRGADGASTSELSEIALRFGARIAELRGLGFKIDLQHRPGGNNLYVLREGPDDEDPGP